MHSLYVILNGKVQVLTSQLSDLVLLVQALPAIRQA